MQQAASFRGVPFLVPGGDVDEGPNSIKHQYPDKRSQYIEDNGLNAPEFQIKAIIKSPDALGKLNALRNALNAGGPGTLKHPFYGTRQVSVMGPYQVHHKDSRNGIFRLSITFVQSSKASFPAQLVSIAASLPGLSAGGVTAVFSDLASNWQRGLSQTSSRIVGASLSNHAAQFERVFSGAGVGGIAAAIKEDALSLIEVPVAMSGLLEEMNRAVFESDLSNGALWSGFRKLDKGLAATAGIAEQRGDYTADLAGRKSNLLNLANSGRAAGLFSMAESALGKTYLTAEQVAADKSQIMRVWNELSAR